MNNSKVCRGFFICIFQHIKACSSSFNKSINWELCFNAYQEYYLKNILISVESLSFCAYKGDGHFIAPLSTYVLHINGYSTDSIVGTLIDFSTNPEQMCIQPDSLGAEPIFFCKQIHVLWATVHIDNFSQVVSYTINSLPIYISILNGTTFTDSTILNEVKQTSLREEMAVDAPIDSMSIDEHFSWDRNRVANHYEPFSRTVSRFAKMLGECSDTTLMLSASSDSRVLKINDERIKQAYTHGNLSSRELAITFEYGTLMDVPLYLVSFQHTSYDTSSFLKMLHYTGRCFFPHWYTATQHLFLICDYPLSARLCVEPISGHYGLNSLVGTDKLSPTVKSMLIPGIHEHVGDKVTIQLLSPKSLLRFNLLRWLLIVIIYFVQSKKQFSGEVKTCLTDDRVRVTTGLPELYKQYKEEPSFNECDAFQLKSSVADLGNSHFLTDTELAKLSFYLPYRYRVNYLLSQYIVTSQTLNLLNQSLPATYSKSIRANCKRHNV